MTVQNKHHVLDQLQSVSKRLASIGGDVKIGTTSGPCPPSMDFPLSSPDAASAKIRRIKRDIKSNLLGVVKEWRYSTVGDLRKASSEDDVTRYDENSSFNKSKKGMVLILNKENVSEFNHIAEEVLLLRDIGIDVLVVIDESVGKRHVDKWIELIGHSRVVDGIDLDSDYSGYVTEFICSL